MRYEQQRDSVSDLRDLRLTLLLEREISDREDLVDEKDIGFHVHCNRESEPSEHTRAICLDRCVDEVANFRELNYLRQSFACVF